MGCSNCDSTATKTLHCCIKRGGRTGRGFIEKSTKKATSENIEDALADDAEIHFLGDSKKQMQILTAELVHRKYVALFKRRTGEQILNIIGDWRQLQGKGRGANVCRYGRWTGRLNLRISRRLNGAVSILLA